MRAEHQAIYEDAKKRLGDRVLVLETGHGYNMQRYRPNWVITNEFTLHEILMLVNGGPLPFGGRRDGYWLVVYTD